MSEFPDNEFTKFFDEQTAIAAEYERQRIFRESTEALVTTSLTAHEASYIWSGDTEVLQDNSLRLMAYVYSRDRDNPNSVRTEAEREAWARNVVGLRLANESTFVSKVLRAKYDAPDLSPEQRSIKKKEIQIWLKIAQFDQGWINMVDDLLEGESLDLSRDADMNMYAYVGQTFMTGDAVSEKLSNLLQTIRGDTSASRINIYNIITPLQMLIRKTVADPTLKPELYAYLDEQVRKGILFADEAEKLRALIH